MDLIPGISGADFFDPTFENLQPDLQVSLWERQNRVLCAMAEIQITLAAFVSPVWGPLVRHSKCTSKVKVIDDYFVKTDPTMDNSSRHNPLGYYSSKIEKRSRRIKFDPETADHKKSSEAVLNALRDNLSVLQTRPDHFLLCNIDLGGHNTIFDNEGHLKAMIDVDTFRFVPIECAAIPPLRLGLDLYHSSSTSIWRAPKNTTTSYISEYAQMLIQAGIHCQEPTLGQDLASQVLSDGIVVAAGLYVLDERDVTSNEEWINSSPIQRLRQLQATAIPLSPPDSNCSSPVDLAPPWKRSEHE